MTDEEFWQALRDMPEPKPVNYRIYYNEQGELLFYSMEDLPGTYIEIDQETYNRNPSTVRIHNGKMYELTKNITTKKRLH